MKKDTPEIEESPSEENSYTSIFIAKKMNLRQKYQVENIYYEN